jgi:hypothetical protein
MTKGLRLSAQNYCTYCIYKIKNEKGKSICLEYNRPLEQSMKTCRLLIPFKKYKEIKNQ